MTTPSISIWAALCKRFEALLSTHDLYQRLHPSSVNGSQATALLCAARELGKEMFDLRQSLVQAGHGGRLSGAYFGRLEKLITDQSMAVSSSEQRAAQAAELMISLSLLRNDLDTFFSDGQEILRLRAERAFRHLQWSIAVTPPIQEVWSEAFDKGETACERLGAAHLLLHGIFAYKANSSGARTDLVFHESIDPGEASNVSDGLVLTEWKKLKDASKLDEVIASAEAQAALYATGVLEGTELRRVRYVVLVSEHQIAMPSDKIKDDYVIRHVNLAINPLSKAAPKLAERSRLTIA